MEPSNWLNNMITPDSKSKQNLATPLSIQNLQLINYRKSMGNQKINFDKKPKTAGSRKSRKMLKQYNQAPKLKHLDKIDYQEIERSQGRAKKA